MSPLNPREQGKSGDIGSRPGIDPYGLRTAAGDLAEYRSEKGQVTVIRQGLSILSGRVDLIACITATTGNDSLSGFGGRDGVVPSAGDFVMVWKQTTPSENGIYIAKSGAWLKRYGFMTGSNLSVLAAGALVSIYGVGTLYGNTLFQISANNTVVGCGAYYK